VILDFRGAQAAGLLVSAARRNKSLFRVRNDVVGSVMLVARKIGEAGPASPARGPRALPRKISAIRVIRALPSCYYPR
jgi:hypothetical protein